MFFEIYWSHVYNYKNEYINFYTHRLDILFKYEPIAIYRNLQQKTKERREWEKREREELKERERDDDATRDDFTSETRN